MSTEPLLLPTGPEDPRLIFPKPAQLEEPALIEERTEQATRDVLKNTDSQAVLTAATSLLIKLSGLLEQKIRGKEKEGKGSVAVDLFYKELGRIAKGVSQIKTWLQTKQEKQSADTVRSLDSQLASIWSALTHAVDVVENGQGEREIGKLRGVELTDKKAVLGELLASVQACRTALGHPAAEA